MPKYNPHIHHRRSIRLKGYDYSQAGLYFITICCKDRAHLFGEIVNAKMELNGAGIMIEKWYAELENKFSDIKCLERVVMPNHFHCILEITNPGVVRAADVRADLRVSPNDGTDNNILGEHIGSPLHRVVQWFKTMTTNEYIRGVKNLDWPRFNGKIWHRNYYERIIKNKRSHQRISQYIIDNPKKWQDDIFNGK